MRTLPVIAALTAVVSLAACAGPGEPAPTSTRRAPSSATSAGTADAPGPESGVAERAARPSLLFGPGSVFRRDIRDAPVDPTSTAQVARLMGQITPNYGGKVAFNVRHFNAALYVATPQTPRVRVGFDNCQDKPGVPEGLYDGPRHFVDVPIPPDARPAEGTDGWLSVWSPETDQLWELWVARKAVRGGRTVWTACWGGRMDHVSRTRRGAFAAPFGVAASGLATVGSVVTIAEAKALRIEHAVQLHVIEARQRDYAWPATRTDGRDPSPAGIPEGAVLRLPASVDVDALPLPPLGKAIARAAQRYGFVVTDQAGSVAVVAESGQAAVAQGRPDPWPAILGGVEDYDVLAGFPWSRLEVVRLGYGAPAGEAAVGRMW